jgi:hypothetical protein
MTALKKTAGHQRGVGGTTRDWVLRALRHVARRSQEMGCKEQEEDSRYYTLNDIQTMLFFHVLRRSSCYVIEI